MGQEPNAGGMGRRSIMRAGLMAFVMGVGALVGLGACEAAPPAKPATKADVEASAEFGRPGDIVLGSPDAPVTLVEYAAMTCSHCAAFHEEIFPVIKEKFIDTGLVKFTMREFPIGGPAVQALSAQAFMVARCKGPDHYYKIVGFLFDKQPSWAYGGTVADAAKKLKALSRNFGLTEKQFDQCVSDQTQFDRIKAVAQQGAALYDITGTPSFVINGKPLVMAENAFRQPTHMEWNGHRYEFPRDAAKMVQILNDALPEDKRVK